MQMCGGFLFFQQQMMHTLYPHIAKLTPFAANTLATTGALGLSLVAAAIASGPTWPVLDAFLVMHVLMLSYEFVYPFGPVDISNVVGSGVALLLNVWVHLTHKREASASLAPMQHSPLAIMRCSLD